MVYNGYYEVMSNIPKMGHLTTPGIKTHEFTKLPIQLVVEPNNNGFESDYVHISAEKTTPIPSNGIMVVNRYPFYGLKWLQ